MHAGSTFWNFIFICAMASFTLKGLLCKLDTCVHVEQVRYAYGENTFLNVLLLMKY